MPYCFDFTFNFFYIWLMSLRKKKTTKGEEKWKGEGRCGRNPGLCPCGRCWWDLSCRERFLGVPGAAQSWDLFFQQGWSGCQGVVRLLFVCVHSLESCARLCPCTQALRTGQQHRVGSWAPREGNNGRRTPRGPGSWCFTAQEALKGTRCCQQS